MYTTHDGRCEVAVGTRDHLTFISMLPSAPEGEEGVCEEDVAQEDVLAASYEELSRMSGQLGHVANNRTSNSKNCTVFKYCIQATFDSIFNAMHTLH